MTYNIMMGDDIILLTNSFISSKLCLYVTIDAVIIPIGKDTFFLLNQHSLTYTFLKFGCSVVACIKKNPPGIEGSGDSCDVNCQSVMIISVLLFNETSFHVILLVALLDDESSVFEVFQRGSVLCGILHLLDGYDEVVDVTVQCDLGNLSE